MFSQDYSQQSSAHAFPTTNNQLFCKERQREGEEAFEGVGGAVSAPSSTKMVSRQSVSSEHSGDELFCLDDPSADTGGFGFGVARNTHVAGTIHLQSYTESDEEYRCDDEIDRDDFLVHHRELEEAKKYQQQQQQQQQHEKNNVAFDASRRGKTVRDLIERIIEFSTESQISVWEDVLLDLRRKEDDDARFILDVNDARHLQFRVPLVEWILDVCAEAQFGPATADVAVEYMVSESFFLCDLFLCAAHIACTRSSSSSSICSPFFRFIFILFSREKRKFSSFCRKKRQKGTKSRNILVSKKKSRALFAFFSTAFVFFWRKHTDKTSGEEKALAAKKKKTKILTQSILFETTGSRTFNRHGSKIFLTVGGAVLHTSCGEVRRDRGVSPKSLQVEILRLKYLFC